MLDGVLRGSRGADDVALARLEAFRPPAPGGEQGGWVPDLEATAGAPTEADGRRGHRSVRSWADRLDPGRRGLAAFVIVALAAGAVGAGAAWRARPRSVDVVAERAAPSEDPVLVVVDVAGRVRRPGLVRLPLGSRVADALARAGGVLPGADVSALNLARKVVDGEQVRVGAPAPAAVTGRAPGSPDPAETLLDLNTATVEQLDTLPGVGPVLAQRIVDYRSSHGSFGAVAQLREVTGIGERKYEDLRRRVRV